MINCKLQGIILLQHPDNQLIFSYTITAPKKKKKPNCMIMWILQKPFNSILDGPQEDNAYSVEFTAKS